MSTDFREFIVASHQAKERLDVYLTREIGRYSRAYVQHLIRDGQVTIEGRPVKANHSVRPNEVIRVHIPPPVTSDLQPEAIPLDICYEDEALIVVNKAAGMVVHPACGNFSGTLVNAVLYHCGQLSTLNGTVRPGIVHRLDKNTSGLIVIAKDDFTHRKLAEQFANRTIQREYRALVWGQPQSDAGRIDTYLARHPQDRKRIAVTLNPAGKHAVTNFEVLEKFDFLSYLRLKLETGRTHQIRVHLNYLGHPVFGDGTYDGRQKMTLGLNQKARQFALELLKLMPFQALHALTLGFVHPSKATFMSLQSDLPAKFQLILQKLQSTTV
ncbi:RluA family pseudouridine synthase [candidate division KSB1 bacterium]|nr:RluA family pseudouridine synthase [candidate division KSB1 bacterium]